MKRRHQGWPPLTSAKHAIANAKGIEQAIATVRPASRTYGSRTSAELMATLPNPYRPPLLASERAALATTLRAAGKGVLALNVIGLIDELDRLRAAIPDLLAAAGESTEQ